MDTEDLTLADLTAAVRAEGRAVDLDGAVRRSGDENAVLETAEWIYRFPKERIDLDREVRLLNALHGRVPVATPKVEWVGEKTRFCAYRKITGRPFDAEDYRTATRARQRSVARSLAEYLAALHPALTEAEISEIGVPDFFTLGQRADLIRVDAVPGEVRDQVRRLIDRAHRIGARVRGRVLLHDDVNSDNMVFDAETARLSGVWDFSHSCVGPACFDFRYLPQEPDPLTADVVHEYESITGHEVDREAFVVAERVAEILRTMRRRGPEDVISAVRAWRADDDRIR